MAKGMTTWTVLDRRAISSSSWSAREVREGPELDVVLAFVDFLRASPLGRNLRGLILLEPLVCHRYPDILLVEYYESKLSEWRSMPCSLENDDLRILHHIQVAGEVDIRTVVNLLGFGRAEGMESLSRLVECGLIWERGRRWHAYRSRDIYPIANIVSVEVKVGRWSDVKEQATFHLWYSNQSVIVNPRRELPSRLKSQIATLGIGVRVPDGAGGWELVMRPKTRIGPASFMSWRIASLVAEVAPSGEVE